MKRATCHIPQAWWQDQPELDRLNALHAIYSQVDIFTYWEGTEGQKVADPQEELPEEELPEYADISQLYQQALKSVEEQLAKLRHSEGRLGQLLRVHWPALEADYRTLQRCVREFVLLHQSEGVYVAQLSEPFRTHLARWRLQLGLLWLELEEQTR